MKTLCYILVILYHYLLHDIASLWMFSLCRRFHSFIFKKFSTIHLNGLSWFCIQAASETAYYLNWNINPFLNLVIMAQCNQVQIFYVIFRVWNEGDVWLTLNSYRKQSLQTTIRKICWRWNDKRLVSNSALTVTLKWFQVVFRLVVKLDFK